MSTNNNPQITATMRRSPFGAYYEVQIQQGSHLFSFPATSNTNKVKAQAVADFINDMPPAVRLAWLEAAVNYRAAA